MNITKYIASVSVLASMLVATPVLAAQVHLGVQASASTTKTASTQERVTNAIQKADQEIARRISSLTDLGGKVDALTKVTDAEKSAVAALVSSEITNLNALKAKIDAETDLTVLKTDIKSIANEYRIYMLVIPVSRIQVAADKIDAVVSTYGALSGKLATRIAAAQSAGKDVTSLNASLSDMNAKTSDASTQASAAVSLVATLKPDNDDQSVMQSNQAAIKSARAKIQTALADLKAARQDAGTIVKGLAAMHPSASASSTVSTQ